MQAMETLKRKFSADDLQLHAKKQQRLGQIPLFYRDVQAMDSLKRKYADDLEFHVKKQRTDSCYFEPCPSMGIDKDTYDIPPLAPEIDIFDTSLPAVPVDETKEMAIVLYKPVIPEVYGNKPIPRAPPTIRLDSRILTTGVLNNSELLRRFGILSTTGTQQSNDSKNTLALIPWVEPSSTAMFPSQVTPSQSSFDTLTNKDGDEEMRAGNVLESEETMEEDSDNINVNEEYINQPSNAVRIEPCQPYELSQPQFGSVMWS